MYVHLRPQWGGDLATSGPADDGFLLLQRDHRAAGLTENLCPLCDLYQESIEAKVLRCKL
jgi:hypothetical protein